MADQEAGDTLRALARQQSAVAQLGELALTEIRLDGLMSETVRVVAEVLGLEHAELLELLPEGRALRVVSGVGWMPGMVGRVLVGTGPDTQVGYTLRADEVVVVEDLTSDPRFRGADLLQEHGIVSGMTCVVKGRDRPWGVLGVHTPRARSFSAQDAAFLRSVANIVAAAAGRTQMEAQLRQSQKLEAVGRLAAGVAHDFNNLLTVMRGYCDLLLEELSEDSPHREEAEGVLREVERGTALTSQLLAFSRRDTQERRTVDLRELISGLHSLLARVLPERVQLECELGDAPLPVEVEPQRIEQVVLNLAVNAVDAIEGEGQVTFTARPFRVVGNGDRERMGQPVAAGRYVRLTITDTGTGIPPHVRARIFEPFFTTKPEDRGTGLGLSVAREIAQSYGGYLLVDSTPGEGSAFHLLLPVADGMPARDPLAASGVAGGEGLSRRTVLVVEDEAAVRRVVARILERAGCHVLTAGSGEEGLELLERHEGAIDAVVCDAVLPRASGLDVIERLRATAPDLKAVLMAGHAQIGAPGGAANAYLAKPFAATDLTDVLERALAG